MIRHDSFSVLRGNFISKRDISHVNSNCDYANEISIDCSRFLSDGRSVSRVPSIQSIPKVNANCREICFSF